MSQLVYQIAYTKCQVSLYLWRIGSVQKQNIKPWIVDYYHQKENALAASWVFEQCKGVLLNILNFFIIICARLKIQDKEYYTLMRYIAFNKLIVCLKIKKVYVLNDIHGEKLPKMRKVDETWS